MTRLTLGGRGPAVIGDLRDPEVDRDKVERYHLEAGRRRARASIAADLRWLRERERVHPLGYVLVFVMAVVMVLWVIA